MLLIVEGVLPCGAVLQLAGVAASLAGAKSMHSSLSWLWVQVPQLAGVLQPGWRGQGPRQAQVLSDLATNMKAMRDAFAAEGAQRG